MESNCHSGYCERCETRKIIKTSHHCSICYQQFCEDCYYKEVYEDDLCKRCFHYMENIVYKHNYTPINLLNKNI